jgi:hypothetical protein
VAVAFDAAAEAVRTDTSSPFGWTHTPSGTPQCIIVFAVHGTSSTDHITAMTYNGLTMSRRVTAADTAGEPGRTDCWILSTAYANGSTIPTGAQTVSATCGSTTDDIWFVSLSFTGNGPVTFFESLNVSTTDGTDPSQSFDPKNRATTLALAGAYSGHDAPATLVLRSGNTLVHDHDFGTFSGSCARQTTPSATGTFIVGWTAASEDRAAVYCQLHEAGDTDARAATTVMPPLLAM